MLRDLDVMVPRNGHYQADWQINDDAEIAIDLTDSSLKLNIRSVAGQGAVLATAAIDPHDPTNGTFTVTINGADLSAVPGQSEIVRLAYDLVITFSDGKKGVLLRGQIILIPGVTY